MEVASAGWKRKRSPEHIPVTKRLAYSGTSGHSHQQRYEAAGADGNYVNAREPVVHDKEEYRTEISGLYSAYDGLSNESSRERRVTYFDAILRAADGSLAGKRLAARLIPRFLKEFPQELPRAVDRMMDLCCLNANGGSKQTASICDGLRRDALEGVAMVLDVATRHRDGLQDIVEKLVGGFLRQVGSGHRPYSNGSVSHGGLDPIFSVLEKVFRAAPREFLSCCIRACQGPDRNLALSSGLVMEEVLLVERGGRSSHRRFDQGNGKRTSVATEVLRDHPEALKWLKHTARSILSDVPSPGHQNFHYLLESLMDRLPGPFQMPYMKNNMARRRSGPPLSHMGRHSSSPLPSLRPQHMKGSEQDLPSARSGPAKGSFQSSRSSHDSGWLPTAVLPSHDNGPCLWFAALPHPLTKQNLMPICSQYGKVDALIFPPAPCNDKALVIFRTPREATKCCHAILNNPVISGGRLICATVPAAGNPCQLIDPLSTCVWVGGPPGSGLESEVLNALQNAGLPPPRHIIRVKGQCPGLLLELQALSIVSLCLDCLEPIDRQEYPFQIPPLPPKEPHSPPPSSKHTPTDRKFASPPWKSTSKVDPPLPPGNWGTSASSHEQAAQFPPPPPPPLPRHPPPPPPDSKFSSLKGVSPNAVGALPSGGASDSSGEKWAVSENQHLDDRGYHRKWGDDSRGGGTGKSAVRRPYWSGKLAKSGVTMCRLVCWDGPKEGVGGFAGVEPLDWPDLLDVRIRVDLKCVLKQLYRNHAPHKRALLRLNAGERTEDNTKLLEFTKYLMDRCRAGVVHLDKTDRAGPRTVYLIPPTESACQSLGMKVESKECLIVLVVPHAAKG